MSTTAGSSTLLLVFTGPALVASRSAATWRRNRSGSTCSSLPSARALLSSMPATALAERRPTAMATASSSSSTSGGSLPPTPIR